MIKKIKILNLFFIIIFLNSCETAKDALQGKKRSDQGDEFLVNKKNPLTMPPDFEKLPIPGQKNTVSKKNTDGSDFIDLLNTNDEKKDTEIVTDQSTDIESSIIKKIE